MATVLVTGASGFIGGHLAEALVSQGEHVRCLVRRSSDLSVLRELDVELILGDLIEDAAVEEAIDGVDVVYHVAGLTAAFDKRDLWRVNERGTTAIAAACARQMSPPVHVYVSSIAAGGPARRGSQRNEAEPACPISHYGSSKLAGEQAAVRFAGRVPTTIVRPGIVFGPRNRECLPIFETIDRCGLHPVAGFRSPPLSYIHIEQLVDLLLRAANRGTRVPDLPASTDGRGYYYASMNEFPSYAEFGQLVAQALGRSRAVVVPIARPVAFAAAGINELLARWRGRADSFNIDKIREANAESWACSSRRAQRELRFEPSGSLAEHLQSTADWYREHGWLRSSRRDPAAQESELSEPLMR